MLRKCIEWMAVLAAVVSASGCEPPPLRVEGGLPDLVRTTKDRDFELEACRARIAAVKASPDLGGTPDYDAQRAEILGRAVGEPAVFVREPPPPTDPAQAGEAAPNRVSRVLRFHRHDKSALRERLLRGGYVYTADPLEAEALVRILQLQDLFDDDAIFLQRGETVHRLHKERARFERGHEYRFTEGEHAGRTATLLFADRVAKTRDELASPLHRDVRALRSRVGFDRITVTHRSETSLLAKLRIGGKWYAALLAADGARLEVDCMDADRTQRAEVKAATAASASRRRSFAALQASADALVAERLPFDRPRGAEDHFSDGHLRSRWEWAYKRGAFSFTHEEEGYLVFDADGKPFPPQTCVEMVIDSFERASGNWYESQGGSRTRTAGFDFNAHGIKSRNGVLAFEQFAEKTPALFTHRRFPNDQRVPFKERAAFFQYLVDHADAFSPGDIVAIQGPKRDGHIHQHAILIRDTDPVTGMPHALTDQMKRPRHRSWEGIMAEAPLRSLLYHIKPTDQLLAALDRPAPSTHLTARADGDER